MTITISTTLLGDLVSDPNQEPFSYVYGMNEQGLAAGQSGTYQTGISQAVIWQNGSISTLSPYNGEGGSAALGINDSGVVIGWSITGAGTNSTYAVEWGQRHAGRLDGTFGSRNASYGNQ